MVSASLAQAPWLISKMSNHLPGYVLERFVTAQPILGENALFVSLFMVALWALNLLAVRDPTMIDSAWGMGFVFIAAISAINANFHLRSSLLLALVAVWGVRLSAYLFRRWRQHGPDDRYVKLMKKVPIRNYALATFVFVYLMQGVFMWIVSLPLQAAAINPSSPLTTINFVGIALALIGMTMEVVADYQLVKFRMKTHGKSDAGVLNTGLWRYTRHPNYFGDALMWWGYYLLSYDSSSRVWWSVIGPITMTYLLRYLSGVPLMDKKLKVTRPGYAEYIENTSSFFPMPPSSSSSKGKNAETAARGTGDNAGAQNSGLRHRENREEEVKG